MKYILHKFSNLYSKSNNNNFNRVYCAMNKMGEKTGKTEFYCRVKLKFCDFFAGRNNAVSSVLNILNPLLEQKLIGFTLYPV